MAAPTQRPMSLHLAFKDALTSVRATSMAPEKTRPFTLEEV